jgi:hypothetical protein
MIAVFIHNKMRSKKFTKKFGQSTLEYAAIIAIATGSLIAMSLYVQCSIKANFKVTEDQINTEQERNLPRSPWPGFIPPETNYEEPPTYP